MSKTTFALLTAAILAVAALGGAICLKPSDGKNYDEVDQFLEICSIPRVSGYNEKIGDYLVNFAKEHDLPYEKDGVGNVMIDHPGTIKKKVILQSHMDMVGIVDEGFTHDFTNDPIGAVIVDGVITAEHTTLGADDGVGMAISLCALKSIELKMYDFRCIFTVDEETTMLGAKNLSADWLDGYDYLLNIDNDIEGQFLFGSAGCQEYSVNDEYTLVSAQGNQYRLEISGLLGGHSGDAIDKNRANAILLAMEFLDGLTNVQLISFQGGLALNAIPDNCKLVFTCTDGYDDVSSRLDSCRNGWIAKYSDKDIETELENVSGYGNAISVTDSGALIDKILKLPNGVSYVWEGYLVSSCNIGILTIANEKMSLGAMSRSAIQSLLNDFFDEFKEQFGNSVEIISESHSWFGNKDSPIFGLASAIYKKLTGKDAEINMTHAGLEAGQITLLCPDIEIISLGPTISEPHTTSESVSIQSLHTAKVLVFELIKWLR